MDDLEDSLKRLFQDSRLDMRVAQDAEKTVVRGARRVRRRRVTLISTAGVMSLAVLAGGTFLLVRPAPQSTQVATQPTDLPITTTVTTTAEPTASPDEARPSQQEPTVPTSATTVAPESTSISRPAEPTAMTTLGPTGFGSFRIGMTGEQVAATRQAQNAARGTDSCDTYRVQSMRDTSTLTVSKRYGLVAITLTANATTPQGVAIGSTEAEVRSTYRATTSATVPENSNAEYRFRFTAGKVSEMALVAKQQDCLP